VSRQEVLDAVGAKGTGSGGIKNQMGVLLSREFRNSLRALPALEKLDDRAMSLFTRLSPRSQEKLRSRFRKPQVIPEVRDTPDLGHKLIATQVRRVYHPPQKIIDRLGYRPLMDYAEGMRVTRSWLAFANLIPAQTVSSHAERTGRV
jgi:hypothetical protein